MLSRPLLLSGFMGAGKTTVGRLAAGFAGVPFVDLDARIEETAGKSVGAVFQEQGEAGFRKLERRLLEAELADGSPRVVALGGGALLDRSVRLSALERATVVTLRASLEATVGRVSGGQGRPLLAGGELEVRASELLRARAEAYAEAHAVIDTTSLAPEQVARQALEVASRGDRVVAAGLRSYRVRVTRGSEGLADAIAACAPSSLVALTDTNVEPLVSAELRRAARSVPLTIHVIEAGERSKGVEGLLGSWAAVQRAGLDRRGLMLGVGGGVVTDLTGFVAGTWQRGVRWMAVPTTLLGMVDAAVGGKTAIDFGPAKNVVGVFHQPMGVFIDVERTLTEPRRGYVSGLAEVVKSALVGDASLLDLIERQPEAVLAREPSVLLSMVGASVAVKASIVSRDERDENERMLLNLGHTLGHALEAQGGFDRYAHGEAVSLGMVAALRVGARMGVTPPGLPERVERLLSRLGLPTRLDPAEVSSALPLLSHDKKREEQAVRLVLVEAPGRAIWLRVGLAELGAHLIAAAGG